MSVGLLSLLIVLIDIYSYINKILMKDIIIQYNKLDVLKWTFAFFTL